MTFLEMLVAFSENNIVLFILGAGAALTGWILPGLFFEYIVPNKIARIVVGVFGVILCVIFAHALYNLYQVWYTTPLGPHLNPDLNY
jgi:hypothetical protein